MSESKKREEGKRPGIARDLLRGGVIGAAAAVLCLVAAAALIAGGAMGNVPYPWVAAAAGLVGGVTAGIASAGKGGGRPVLKGVGAGAVLLLLLFAGGILLGEGMPSGDGAHVIPAACLCGGAAGSLIGVKRGDARQKRRPPAKSRPRRVYK